MSNVFCKKTSSRGQVFMKKLSMISQVSITFEEGCDMYILNCKQRNLRQRTINHYKQRYTQFYKFFDPDMPIEEFDEDAYKMYVLHLKTTQKNDVNINSYLRDYITTIAVCNIFM